MQEEFPRPPSSGDGAAFWEFARLGELRVQRCIECALHRYFPRPRCARCQSPLFEWALCAGTGSVHSYTICYPPVLPAFATKVPYNVVVVELDEGPFIVSNLVGCENEEIAVGMAVEACFVVIDEALTIPQFRPVAPTP
jgi:uncharacterized OB-fold protein